MDTGDEGRAGDPRRRHVGVSASVFVLTVVVVLLVAAFLELHGGWSALGDDAVIAARAHDVFSHRIPMVGMPSTLPSTAGGAQAAHPGPLLFYVLAIPERFAGSTDAGLVVGAALISATAFVLLGAAAWRAAGRAGLWLAVAVGAAACASLGRLTLVDPWNASIALVPLLAMCCTAWLAMSGDDGGLVATIALASFAAQAHTLYDPLAGLVGATALVGYLVAHGRRSWRRRGLAVSVGVAAVLWAAPIVDEIKHHPGNLTLIWRSLRVATPHVGLSYATRALFHAIGVPPIWLDNPSGSVVDGRAWSTFSIVSATFIVVALAALLVRALRRHDGVVVRLFVLVFVVMVAAVWSIAQVPPGFPDVARYRLALLVPVSAFVWFALVFATLRLFDRSAMLESTSVRAVLAGAVAIATATSLFGVVGSPGVPRPDEQLAGAADTFANEVRHSVPPASRVLLRSLGVASEVQLKYAVFDRLVGTGYDIRVDASDAYLGRWHAIGAAPPVATVVLSDSRLPDRGGQELLGTVTVARVVDRADFEATRAALLSALAHHAPQVVASRAAIARAPLAVQELLARMRARRASPRSLIGDNAFEEALRTNLVRAGSIGWGDVARYQIELQTPRNVTADLHVYLQRGS